ncbi:hypothetical protein U6B65_06670 [Oscillospiraceae bacterium MB08-C2-2]|nr:hypothetical protein U6B65_06670 [Oscillospiraceae bacterium MB08-C2-2]
MSMTVMQAGLVLMGLGLLGVFTVIILLYILILVLGKLPVNK